MKTILKALTLGFAVIAIAATLNGCNTVKGFGQDLSAGGNSLQKAAEDHN